MFSAKTMSYVIKNLLAILIALFVFATLTLNARENPGNGKQAKVSKKKMECCQSQLSFNN